MHSIHYLDLIRQLLGDPLGVHAKTLGHPAMRSRRPAPAPSSTMATRVRCALSINHDHKFGRKYQACEFRICGTEGAAYLKLGLNLDYPRGEPDVLEIHPKGGTDWIDVPLAGAWFPDAFVGRMANVQRFASGEDAELVSSVEDAWTHHGAGRGRLSVERSTGDADREKGPDMEQAIYFEDYELGHVSARPPAAPSPRPTSSCMPAIPAISSRTTWMRSSRRRRRSASASRMARWSSRSASG